MNNILQILINNECMSMKVDMYDTKTQGISSWFMNKYKIRADDKKIIIYGKDEDVACHWIKLAVDSMITDFEQDSIFNVIVLRFTYNNRYLVEMKIDTLKKKIEAFGKTPIFKQHLD